MKNPVPAVSIVIPTLNEEKPNKLITIRHAKRLSYDRSLGVDARRLIGDVECEHEGAVMRCDSAYLFSDKKLIAYGHISIIKGDSIFVYGDSLRYDATTKPNTQLGVPLLLTNNLGGQPRATVEDIYTKINKDRMQV